MVVVVYWESIADPIGVTNDDGAHRNYHHHYLASMLLIDPIGRMNFGKILVGFVPVVVQS